MDLDRLLKFMTDKGASDLHLKPTRPPLLRINGRLLPIEAPPLKPEELTEMLMGILSPRQKTRLEERMSVDTGYGVRGLARFRCNMYMQRGSMAACFRRIPYQIKSLEDLELPPVLLEFCEIPMGLVLITGPTGSGKSTTLAAMIDYINRNRDDHIITIEDPIEFVHPHKRCLVHQREVGVHTQGFKTALRAALREDPDVIMVGEMRDPETVSTVITAAETGHLVFSTLHTNSAPQTVDRILDTFPSDQQPQVRAQLAQILKGVVSMKLVERADGQGRVAALEILRSSPKISKMIEEGEISQIHEEMESSVGYYRMQSTNQSLLALLVHGTITYLEAMRQSPDPEDLSLKLRKMFPMIEERGGELSPVTSDFSQIVELQQFKRLYEEQEEKIKLKLAEKDEQIVCVQQALRQRDQQIEEVQSRLQEAAAERERLRGDYARLRQEAQEKIDKLMERIKELNQRLMGDAGSGSQQKSGIFR